VPRLIASPLRKQICNEPSLLAVSSVRPCEEDNVAAITAIYAHHVLYGLASFEIAPPSENDMHRRRLEIVGQGFPYLVAERAGDVVGYAYASPYRLRPAYRYTAENSVYLHPAWTGRGIGRQLMSALLAECEARGFRQIVAVIGDSANIASIALHQRPWLSDGGDDPVGGLQIRTLGRYRTDAAVARRGRQHTAMRSGGRATVVAAIGTTQTIAWASSYYMPAILGPPIAAALHVPSSVFFGLFSEALLLSAVVGPSVGRLIDRQGGRGVLVASNLVIAAGLMILAAAHGIAGLVIAWAVLGVGIGMGLYDSAFAALTWLYGREARSSITGITLIAGFASTIGWPLSALFLHELDWRAACLIWAGLNVLLAAPLNWLTIPRQTTSGAPPRGVSELRTVEPPRAAMPILAFFFSATWFVQGAMAAHLPGLLQAAGASAPAAIAAAALVGPAQVGARIVEFGVLRSFHPISSARLASALHPLGAAFLVALGAPGIIAFALLHGAGNGMITITKGTLPLALFGPQGYGLRSGLLSAPARTLQSASPFLFGLLLDRVGIGAVGLSTGLCLAACGSLFLLRPRGPVGPHPSSVRS